MSTSGTDVFTEFRCQLVRLHFLDAASNRKFDAILHNIEYDTDIDRIHLKHKIADDTKNIRITRS